MTSISATSASTRRSRRRSSGTSAHTHWAQGDQSIDSCAILVTEANELTKGIHDRMPVILAPEAYDAWMDRSLSNPEPHKALLKPYPSERMVPYPVSTAVNGPKNEQPELIVLAQGLSTSTPACIV
jgi:putative SOS response-associated peptidase YedK